MSITKHIQIKRTSTPGKKPQPGDIEIGELAVNLADKLLFTKDTKNNIIPIGAPVVDNLTTADPKKSLSAKQGKVLEDKKLNKSDVVDNLTTADPKKALSAKQGKTLQSTKENSLGKPSKDGQFLASTRSGSRSWTTATLAGLADTNMSTAPKTNQILGFDGSKWVPSTGGATGGGSDQVFYLNDQVITKNYTLHKGKNAHSAGPITINDGITVEIPDGTSWTIS